MNIMMIWVYKILLACNALMNFKISTIMCICWIQLMIVLIFVSTPNKSLSGYHLVGCANCLFVHSWLFIYIYIYIYI